MEPASQITTLLTVGAATQLAGWGLLLRAARRRSEAAVPTQVALSRAGLDSTLDAELERTRLLERRCALLIYDVDRLTLLNERLGFRRGDEVLARISAALREAVRGIDSVADLGGGSLAVLLPDAHQLDLEAHAEQLRWKLQRAVAAAGDGDEDSSEIVTLSCGFACFPDHAETTADLLQAADQALFAAKDQGGARTQAWTGRALDAVRNAAGRRRAQRDSQLATVLSLAEALDLRDADTSNHSQMVGHYAELMAIGLGLPPAQVERIRVAGLLHDIGKIGVPDSVLRKPAKLDDHEWAQMQRHPEIGARMLSSVDAEDIRSWVLAHHERPDGRGYPFGLNDAEIPLGAKILAVADSYEAMTADRVYRAAPGPEFARGELVKCTGTQFDARVVEVFLDVLDQLAADFADEQTAIAIDRRADASPGAQQQRAA